MLSLITAITAIASPPSAEATISLDGEYTLVIRSPCGWEEAEVAVAGGGAEDVGAVEAGQELRIEGSLEQAGTMWVTIQAAIDDHTGKSWTFSVEPELVPVSSPRMQRLSRRSLRWRLFRRRRS